MAKFLYVEDDDEAREIGKLLMQMNCPQDELVTAASYHEAVKILAEQSSLDGIISDFNYSGVADNGEENASGCGGLDLLEHTRKTNIRTPVVFLTARMPFEIQRALGARKLDAPDHIFYKPILLTKMVESMKQMFCQETRPSTDEALNGALKDPRL